MKARILSVVALLASAALAAYAAIPGKAALPAPAAKIAGDYVEARTASVFAGACHYNGEYDTTGRDALLAWNFTGGTVNGTDLTGVRTIAAVTCDANLGNETAARQSELVIDSAATPQQASAVEELLRSKCKDLGTITAIHRAPVAFVHANAIYTVSSAGFASLSVQESVDHSCCIQPNLVWYSPLAPVENRMVGFTQDADFTGSVGEHWSRQGENGAFYGTIAF